MIEIKYTLDLERVKGDIASSLNLENDAKLFEALASLAAIKEEFKQAADTVDEVDRTIKQHINDRAKALYGTNWEAIVGDNYKITKSSTGSVYEATDEAPEEFLVIKKSVDTKAVETEVKKTGKLPVGIEFNGKRGESIRITLKK